MTSSNKKTVVVLGKGSLAIAIAEWFHRSEDYHLRCVVPALPEPEWTVSLIEWCHQESIPIIESGDYADIPGLHDSNDSIDLAFSVYYGEIIKPWFFECVEKTLNLHNSPLPKYRGCNPINWALKNGETIHGVTIHEMTRQVDAGPILSQVQFTIDPKTDEVIDVYNRALAFGFTLFQQTIPHFDRISPRLQDEIAVSHYRRSDARKLGDRRSFTRADSNRELPSAGVVLKAKEQPVDVAFLLPNTLDRPVRPSTISKRGTP